MAIAEHNYVIKHITSFFPSFCAIQMIRPFLNSMVSANNHNGKGHQPMHTGPAVILIFFYLIFTVLGIKIGQETAKRIVGQKPGI